MNYDFIVENMIFSFSRLSSFYNCAYCWKLSYLDCIQGEQNFFSEYGTLLHGVIEKFCKNEAEIYELPSIYEEEYSKVVKHKAPPNKFVDLNESYYNQGLKYLEEFEGFGEYEIVATEKEIYFEINNIKIKGYIDLLVKDKEGNLHIIDHKSSDVKSKNSDKAKEYWKQLYLYSIPIFEEYGVYPKQLHINAFRKQQWFTIDFDEKQVEEVKKWVVDTVDKIKKETKFAPLSSGYFCNFLCGYRDFCEYKPREI
jgi:CRISPR/Cas system-associated exonuclease Cas4 (RecB family)